MNGFDNNAEGSGIPAMQESPARVPVPPGEEKGIAGLIKSSFKRFAGAGLPIARKLGELTAREKNVLVLGGFVCMAILVYVWGAEPMFYQYREMKLEASRTAERVSRYKSVVETSEGDRMKNREYVEAFNTISERCFEGKTEDIAAGKLIELVTQKAASANIGIKSTKVEKVRIVPGYKILNVSVAFDAPLNSLALFTQSIEQENKKIVFREAKIHSRKETYGNHQEEKLSVELVLSGLQYMQ
jgi:hypothetical protein